MGEIAPKIIYYVGYPDDVAGAPHQGMVRHWLRENGHTVIEPREKFAMPQAKSRLKAGYFAKILEVLRKGMVGASTFFDVVKLRPDVIYIQGAQNTVPMLWTTIFFRNIVVVYHTQDVVIDSSRWIYVRSERLLARKAHHVVCNEINRARFMMAFHKLKEMPFVVPTYLPFKEIDAPNGFVPSDYLDPSAVECFERCNLIAVGGSFSPSRCSRQLVSALQFLPDDVALVFTGMTSEKIEQLDSACKMLDPSIRTRCICLPSLPYPDLRGMFDKCKLGTLLYPNDSFGNFYQGPGRLTEYLRAGLPVLMSNSPSFNLLNCRYDLGVVADTDRAEDIANAIAEALSRVSKSGEYADYLKNLTSSELYYEKAANTVFEDILDFN